jgi:hypothetical protein
MFENERLEDILKKLERHYDVSIQNNHAVSNDNSYTGTFDIETIAEVIKIFSQLKGFSYEIDNKELLCSMVQEMYDELPAPKPKKKK